VSDPRLVALRVLRDCGVVFTGAGRTDFGGLVSEGLADVTRVLCIGAYRYDYSLTARGKALAESMWP